MAIRYDHSQALKTALMIANGSATDTVYTESSVRTNAVIFRAYINPGFNATLEWLEHSLSFSLTTEAAGAIQGEFAVMSGKFQIRCRGEAAFTDLAVLTGNLFNVGHDEGTATAGTATTLTDTGAAWPVNGLIGMSLQNGSRTEPIISNTATVITTATGATWAGSVYEIRNQGTTFYADGTYDAVAGTSDTAPLEIQLVITTSAAVALDFSIAAASMSVRAVGESV